MTSAIVAAPASPEADRWAGDLEAVGVAVVGRTEAADLLGTAIRLAPDVVVCFENHPDDALFSCISALNRSSPRPVVVFTSDPDAERIEQAARSGVHAYVVNGYGLHRLRSVIQTAQARFRHGEIVRTELAEVSQRFEERKLVDRAKGILMGARQIREDEAFRALRTAAMNSKQRIGQVSRQIIDASRYAEAVNRAGQLRMFSQRIVKLQALLCAGVGASDNRALLAESVETVDRNLASLGKTVSQATFGDLIEGVQQAWTQVKAALAPPTSAANLKRIDDLAEVLLARSERLTANLEMAGYGTNLRVINLSGRQRMLSQRLAKQALLASLAETAPSSEALEAFRSTEREFVEALAELTRTPLVTPEIADTLALAQAHWQAYEASLRRVGSDTGKPEIATLSETILEDFDRLTDAYERGIQMLFA